jgi:hypothetical protein
MARHRGYCCGMREAESFDQYTPSYLYRFSVKSPSYWQNQTGINYKRYQDYFYACRVPFISTPLAGRENHYNSYYYGGARKTAYKNLEVCFGFSPSSYNTVSNPTANQPFQEAVLTHQQMSNFGQLLLDDGWEPIVSWENPNTRNILTVLCRENPNRA